MTYAEAILIAIVEGLTEFLPVSSTGHMIIVSSLMGIQADDFTKLFTVAIQLGAILSVVVLYAPRFLRGLDLYQKLFVAFLPAAIFGLLLNDTIDSLLERADVVGYTLFFGGAFLLFVDRIFPDADKSVEEQEVKFPVALRIGLFQVVSMIPGVSRSAATIIGGLFAGLNRRTAAEFSFLLAVPTMFAATAKKLLDFYQEKGLDLTGDQLGMLAVGNVVAFIVALVAIRTFISFLQQRGFRLFGWYRMIVGLVVLILYYWVGNLQII